MRAACEDLNVALETLHYEDDTIQYLQYAYDIAGREAKPDIVFMNVITDGDALAFKILDNAGIDIFTINSSFSSDEFNALGGPRGEIKRWIGQMIPNDIGVGEDVALSLYEKAKKIRQETGLVDKRQGVYVGAVQGVAGVRASDARIAGLYKILNKKDDLHLTKIVSGEWSSDLSEQAALRILDFNTAPDIIFAVHDVSAISVVRAVESKGMIAGRDVLTAGIDWYPDVFPYIKDGRIEASYGGHFMEGAWAVILAYDYKNGHDFYDVLGTTIYSKMERIDANNVLLYEEKIKEKAWLNLDFKALTRTHNQDFEMYNFDLGNLLDITSGSQKNFLPDQ